MKICETFTQRAMQKILDIDHEGGPIFEFAELKMQYVLLIQQ